MNWKNVKENAVALKNLATQKIGEAGDLAALKLRLAADEYQIKGTYTDLGRAAYRHFSQKNGNAQELSKLVASVKLQQEEIDRLRELIAVATERLETTIPEEKPEEPAEATDKAEDDAEAVALLEEPKEEDR